MGCPPGKVGEAIGSDSDELQALREHDAIATFDLMRDEKEQRGLVSRIGRVDQHRALPQEICMALQNNIGDRKHERVSGMKELGKWCVCLIQRAHGVLRKADALVALQYRSEFSAVAS